VTLLGHRTVDPSLQKLPCKTEEIARTYRANRKVRRTQNLNRSEVSLALKRSGELLDGDQDGLTSNGIEGTGISFR